MSSIWKLWWMPFKVRLAGVQSECNESNTYIFFETHVITITNLGFTSYQQKLMVCRKIDKYIEIDFCFCLTNKFVIKLFVFKF